jgi:hypothetical protein
MFEVVVAVAVLGLVLTTAFGLLGAGLRSLHRSREYTRAVILARQKLDETLLHEPEHGVEGGGFTGEYQWSTESFPDGPEAKELAARLFQHRVKVSWVGRGQEKSLELVTLSPVMEEEKLPAAVAPKLREDSRAAGRPGSSRFVTSAGRSLRGMARGGR